MNAITKWLRDEKEAWNAAKKEVEEQIQREDEAWDKWRRLPEELKWKHGRSSSSGSDGRFWPFGEDGFAGGG